MKNLSNLIKDWKIKVGGIVVLSLVSLYGGCNESYLAEAAVKGYSIKSRTPEGMAAEAALSEYFRNEGDRQTALDSKTQVNIYGSGDIRSDYEKRLELAAKHNRRVKEEREIEEQKRLKAAIEHNRRVKERNNKARE